MLFFAATAATAAVPALACVAATAAGNAPVLRCEVLPTAASSAPEASRSWTTWAPNTGTPLIFCWSRATLPPGSCRTSESTSSPTDKPNCWANFAVWACAADAVLAPRGAATGVPGSTAMTRPAPSVLTWSLGAVVVVASASPPAMSEDAANAAATTAALLENMWVEPSAGRSADVTRAEILSERRQSF